MRIADTILAQIGGNKFLAMTGARSVVAHEDGLSFRLPKGAKDRINYIRIVLERDDTYTMKFYRLTRNGLENHLRGEQFLVHAPQLRSIFTRRTGLDTHL